MRLSQTHFISLEYCPRLFQYQWIEQLGLTVEAIDPEDSVRSGSEFHQLVQQRSLSLPIDAWLLANPQLQQWWTALTRAEPSLFGEDALQFQASEQVRTWECLGQTLVVVYDWVQFRTDRAVILDWKTYPKPEKPQWVAKNWQSRLYPFVLMQTSDYSAEQIEMRYWFLEPNAQPLRLPYNSEQATATERDLTTIVTQLNQNLAAYEADQTPFPQTDDRDRCQDCLHRVRCGRAASGSANPAIEPELQGVTWAEIPEIQKN